MKIFDGVNFEKLRLPYRDDSAFSLLTVCIFITPLAFSFYAYENFESVKFGIFLLCTGTSLCAFLFGLKTGKVVVKKIKYFYYLLTAFGIWALFSALIAPDKLYSIFGFYYRYTNSLVFFATFLTFIFLLINLADENRLKFLLKIVVFDALLVALVAYFEGFGWLVYQGLSSGGGFFHGPSLLGNTDYSAMFLACALPLATYFFTVTKNFKAKIYYGFCIFSIIFSCLILASRGALLAMIVAGIVALILFVVFRFPKKFLLSLVLSAVLIGFFGKVFLSVSRPGAVSGIITTTDPNTNSRFYAWETSIRGVIQHPILGSGLGNYALFFEKNRLTGVGGGVGVFDDAHNLFLYLAVTGGLPLALLFIGLILFATYKGLRGLGKDKNLLTVSLLSSLGAWIVGASFNPVPIPMYILLSIVLVYLVSSSAKPWEVNWNIKKLIFPFALAVFILIFGVASLASEHLLGIGVSASAEGNYLLAERLDGLAFFLNPTNALSLSNKIVSSIYLNRPKPGIEKEILLLVKIHPTQSASFVTASNIYAILYNQTGEKKYLQSAIASMKKALTIDPLYPERYGQTALYYYQLGDLESAHIFVGKDLAINKLDFSAWMLLARIYQSEKNKTSTIFALSQAFKLNPNITQLKYLLLLAKILPDITQVPIQLSVAQPTVK